MKQTAVQWLEQQMKKFAVDLDLLDCVEQAKEMEKEQIRDSFLIGWSEPSKYESDSLIYYNETYGGSK